MDQEQKRRMYDKLTSSQIPCLVFSRDQEPDEDLLEFCNYYGVPCLVSDKTTSALMAEIIRWLNVKPVSYTHLFRDCTIFIISIHPLSPQGRLSSGVTIPPGISSIINRRSRCFFRIRTWTPMAYIPVQLMWRTKPSTIFTQDVYKRQV